MRFMVKMSFGGNKKKLHRFYGAWESQEKAQTVADRWTYRVAGRFFGDITFDVVELESGDQTIDHLRDVLREEGMN